MRPKRDRKETAVLTHDLYPAFERVHIKNLGFSDCDVSGDEVWNALKICDKTLVIQEGVLVTASA